MLLRMCPPLINNPGDNYLEDILRSVLHVELIMCLNQRRKGLTESGRLLQNSIIMSVELFQFGRGQRPPKDSLWAMPKVCPLKLSKGNGWDRCGNLSVTVAITNFR